MIAAVAEPAHAANRTARKRPPEPPIFDLRELLAFEALLESGEAREYARRFGPAIFPEGALRDYAVSILERVSVNELALSGDPARFRAEEDALADWLSYRVASGRRHPATDSESVAYVRRLAQVRAVEVAAEALERAVVRLRRGRPFSRVAAELQAALSAGVELEGRR